MGNPPFRLPDEIEAICLRRAMPIHRVRVGGDQPDGSADSEGVNALSQRRADATPEKYPARQESDRGAS